MSIIFSHHPFFLKDIAEEDGYFQIQKAKRQEYFNICTELDVNALYAGHLHNNSEGSYEGLPDDTTTSVAFQIGPAQPSIRVITVQDGVVTDLILELSKCLRVNALCKQRAAPSAARCLHKSVNVSELRNAVP